MPKFHVPEAVIYVCAGSKCGKKGGKDLCKQLKHLIKESHLQGKVEIMKVECTDRCKFAPVLSVQPANVWLCEASENDASHILEVALKGKTE